MDKIAQTAPLLRKIADPTFAPTHFSCLLKGDLRLQCWFAKKTSAYYSGKTTRDK
ncbi:MAG: hypothetical protein PHC94_11665 [Methylobacter sp.]|nr:hypothetical protein [Methylococcales bacterium]MDD5114664.1 hypothetical protein [Methylobacter sp.]